MLTSTGVFAPQGIFVECLDWLKICLISTEVIAVVVTKKAKFIPTKAVLVVIRMGFRRAVSFRVDSVVIVKTLISLVLLVLTIGFKLVKKTG